jgi:hypothetical protein
MSGWRFGTQYTHLVGIAFLQEARDFIHVEAKAMLDIETVARLHPKLYRTVEESILRGYRVTDRPIVIGLEQQLLHWCMAPWKMSYLGKGFMQVRLTSYNKMALLTEAIKGLTALMTKPCVVRWNGTEIAIKAPVEIHDRVNSNRTVPRIVASFQELRPLIVREIEGERELRQEALDVWRSKRVLDLDWSK